MAGTVANLTFGWRPTAGTFSPDGAFGHRARALVVFCAGLVALTLTCSRGPAPIAHTFWKSTYTIVWLSSMYATSPKVTGPTISPVRRPSRPP